MLNEKRRPVATWRVTVNNSGRSNMNWTVGRYLTREAAERVAATHRGMKYEHPENYMTETDFDPETREIKTTVVADVTVTVEPDPSYMDDAQIRFAIKKGIAVLDEHGKPILVGTLNDRKEA